MMTVAKIFRWLVQRVTAGLLIVAAVFVVCGLWIYLRESLGFAEWRDDTIRMLTGERAKWQAALVDVEQRLQKLGGEIEREQDRLQQADKVIADLKALESTWDRYVGDREQQKKNEERLATVTGLRDTIREKIARDQEQFTRTTWERDGLKAALGRLETQLKQIEAKKSALMHYVERTWNYEVRTGRISLPLRWWVLIALGLYFLGPSVGRVVLYFGVAPLIGRGRPVRFQDHANVLPEVAESRVSIDLDLHPGDRLCVKETFLQGSDEALSRKTRYLLDWRIPLTCVATGLMELIEISNPTPRREGARVTLSNQANPQNELCLVTIPEGSSLILRPRFIAGVVTPRDKRLSIRRHWEFLRWHSWVTLQFRYFEFVGPCRILLAGSRGVRSENLSLREGQELPARRTNREATVGFTPNLSYQPVRAETFWSYYRGMNSLYDDLFTGRGLFLSQQVATAEERPSRNLWSTLWSGVLKVFGL